MMVVVQAMPEPLVQVPSGPISVKERGDIDAPMAHKTKRGAAETNDEAPPSGYEADAETNEADIFYDQAEEFGSYGVNMGGNMGRNWGGNMGRNMGGNWGGNMRVG